MFNDDSGDAKGALPALPAKKKDISRRAVLKAGAAVTGAAIGSDAISGFPTIWAQEIKDIELRHVGVSYSVVKAIGDQAAKDLGFKVTMQNLDTSAAINRFISQPNTVDIADLEGWQAKLAAKRGVIQGIKVKKIKEFDNILPIFTKGEIDGHKIPRQGISPYEAMYIAKPNATDLHDGVTEWATFLPQVYNADSIGYRPDLVGHEVTEWKDLIDPKYKGKAAILDVPAIGIMDAALCFESAGLIRYGNKGNMTKQEIDFTMRQADRVEEGGPIPCDLDHLRPVGAVDGCGRSRDPVDVVAGGCGRARQGDSLRLRAGQRQERQGRLSRLVQRHGPDEASDRQEARCGLRISQLVSIGLAGRLRRPLRLLQPGAVDGEEVPDAAEWDFWYDGKPAPEVIKDPYGVPMEKAGTKRDGGSFLDRVKNISCWNTLMDEAAYMNKRWNDFKIA